MHAVVEEPELEPCDLFVDLGLLIIEGRTPRPTARGYGEGPHCTPPYGPAAAAAAKAHTCSPQDGLCVQQENLRKHMLLLWKNSIPISIEVLLCPDCCSSDEKVGEATAGPEPSFVLLEQWHVHMLPRGSTEVTISSRALFQAVRSYLHFSQLGAWYSLSAGESPKNVIYRVCVPGEAFSNKFVHSPEEHVFPTAAAGWHHTVRVSVRALPRRPDGIPRLACPLHDHTAATACYGARPPSSSAAPHTGSTPPLSPPSSTGSNQRHGTIDSSGDAGRNSPKDNALLQQTAGPSHHLQQPAAPPRRRCSTTAAVSRGLDSPTVDGSCSSGSELMLGDSLLDPPQLLEMYPRRYQSPSRSGSPVMEMPEHWMFGGRGFRGKSAGTNSASSPAPRERGRPWKRIDHETTPTPPTRTRKCGIVELNANNIPATKTTTVDVDEVQARLTECGADGSRLKRHLRSAAQLSMSPQETDLVMQSLRLGLRPPDPLLLGLLTIGDDEPARCRCREVDVPVRSSGKWRTDDTNNGTNRKKDVCSECGGNETEVGTAPRPHHPARKPPDIGLGRGGVYPRSPLARVATDRIVGRVFPHEISTVRTDLLPAVHAVTSPTLMTSTVSASAPSSKLASRCGTTTIDKAEPPDGSGGVVDWCGPLGRDVGRPRSWNNALEGDKWTAQLLRCRRSRDLKEREIGVGNDGGRTGGGVVSSSTVDDGSECATNQQSIENPQQPDTGKTREVPSASDKAKFRRYLDSAASLVFHTRTGLPLTSSPAPIRKGTSFDFDIALTSVSAKKFALFDKITPLDEDDVERQLGCTTPSALNSNSSLLGNFEESVLNGRLEPVSTVEGFTAEIGASGSFCPRHVVLPVTVFFYTLSDVDKVSTPYLGHINLGKKGYHVPKNGTIQVTLFNPHETVVKMFVVMYDLRDMPPRCQTFLRQRTLYMPVDASDGDPEARKWLRYLIHLRFASSKSGRTYLHTDIRIVIFRKSDMDAAAVHGKSSYELRSFTRGPSQPQFSPRK